MLTHICKGTTLPMGKLEEKLIRINCIKHKTAEASRVGAIETAQPNTIHPQFNTRHK